MLTKTGIEYATHAWNFYPGCLHKSQGKCPVAACWAEGMSKRQRQDFHKPHLIAERLLDPLKRKKPARILVNFMGDLFGSWVDPFEFVETDSLQDTIIEVVHGAPQHTFLFLTKAPENIWPIEWPDNCWMGASAWDGMSLAESLYHLSKVKATHKWPSIEPLLGQVVDGQSYVAVEDLARDIKGISWVVIGAQTRPDVMPRIEWVREIVKACDAAGVKVWLKNNLKPLLIPSDCSQPNGLMDDLFFWEGKVAKLRQELPPRTERG